MQSLEIGRKTVEKAVKKGASQAEATVVVTNSALTRFTRNAIHQNVAQRKYLLNLEVVVDGKRRGSMALNSLGDADIDESLDRVLKIARVSTPDPDFVSLPEPREIAPLSEIFNKKTAEVTPEDRVEGVQALIDAALDHDKRVRWSTGAYSTESGTYAVANSLGVEAETAYARASVDIVTKAGKNEDGSGYSARFSRDVGEFDFEAMARKAAEDAVNGIAPDLIPIGEYEAVFTPATLSTFTGFMGQLGFSARAYQDGYSCLTDRIGSQVFDEKLTIHDMGRSLETFNAMPFDGEGVPKGTLRLVDGGVPENLCYDSYTALKDGVESTGHALPKSGRFFFRGMPLPLNMVVEPGEATVEEMIEDTKRGVYLTRLHYVNAIRRDLAVISGLTRDACWLIEDGEVKHPIKVMRFTDSVIRVMSGIDAIGGESTVGILPYETLPAVKVSSFRFTGQSEF
jgi:predicted Zn-dependent protease